MEVAALDRSSSRLGPLVAAATAGERDAFRLVEPGRHAAKFDPTDGLTFPQILWLRADGSPERSERIHASPGPGHCGWESTIFLRFEGVQYLRDPEGLLAERRSTWSCRRAWSSVGVAPRGEIGCA